MDEHWTPPHLFLFESKSKPSISPKKERSQSELSVPYMHNGKFATLGKALSHYEELAKGKIKPLVGTLDGRLAKGDHPARGRRREQRRPEKHRRVSQGPDRDPGPEPGGRSGPTDPEIKKKKAAFSLLTTCIFDAAILK
jgi:hypothetical protein